MEKKRWPFYMLLAAAILSLVVAGGCIKRRDTQRTREMRGRSVEQTFDSHRDRLLSVPGVVGAGIARLDGQPSIVVMIRERTPDLAAQIPSELDGYPVVIEIIGDFKAQNDSL